MTAETGTYRWMAPEVIEHKAYDTKADIFSFGIVIWELLTGKVPYAEHTALQVGHIHVVRCEPVQLFSSVRTNTLAVLLSGLDSRVCPVCAGSCGSSAARTSAKHTTYRTTVTCGDNAELLAESSSSTPILRRVDTCVGAASQAVQG